jgi:hypothetical protein
MRLLPTASCCFGLVQEADPLPDFFTLRAGKAQSACYIGIALEFDHDGCMMKPVKKNQYQDYNNAVWHVW